MPRKQRRAQWASITEVEKGKRYRIRYWGKDASGEYRRLSCTVRGTRKDAELRRAELMLDHSEDAPCPTVGQAWERWTLPTFERRVEGGDMAESTLYRYQKVWASSVEPTWADVPLDAVRPLAVQQWISAMRLTTAKIAVVVLSAIMDHAVRYEVVDHNPMREKYLMPSASTVSRRDEGVWSLSELVELWQRVRGEWFEPAFLLAAFGGCRVGEAFGPLAGEVRSREVDGYPLAVVGVQRQVQSMGGVSERLKTRQSARPVVVAGDVALRLVELAAALPPDWYLTHDGIGGPQAQWRLNDSWTALGTGRPFKNLRNSWQTVMRWELGVPPHYIEPMMGHKVPGVTGAHYDKPTEELFCDVAARAWKGRI